MHGGEEQRFICGRQAPLPSTLVTTVLGVANADDPGAYSPDDVHQVLVCAIDHSGPAHHAVALNLRGPEAGALWTRWCDDVEPSTVVELPDCLAVRNGEACSEFDGHPGGHSWELNDPPRVGPEPPCLPPRATDTPVLHRTPALCAQRPTASGDRMP